MTAPGRDVVTCGWLEDDKRRLYMGPIGSVFRMASWFGGCPNVDTPVQVVVIRARQFGEMLRAIEALEAHEKENTDG